MASGTFTREVARVGSRLDAAQAKIAAAFPLAPAARFALVSEGSFGPHPHAPIVPLGREFVALSDPETGVEVIGHFADMSANVAHVVVSDTAAAVAFAERVGFPRQGVIVIGYADGNPSPKRGLVKTIVERTRLERAVDEVICRCGAAFVETDLRAQRNPRRMRTIKRASLDLVRAFRSRCPACARPGFVVSERVPGVPCSWCGEPTGLVRAMVLTCTGCRQRVERPGGPTYADPGRCDSCNP